MPTTFKTEVEWQAERHTREISSEMVFMVDYCIEKRRESCHIATGGLLRRFCVVVENCVDLKPTGIP